MKTRFKAYKFYKDGKPIPGLLTVRYGKLLPEFCDVTYLGYVASWPASHPCAGVEWFAPDNKAEVEIWKRHRGADRVIKIIVER